MQIMLMIAAAEVRLDDIDKEHINKGNSHIDDIDNYQ